MQNHAQSLPEALFAAGGAPLLRLDVSHNALRALPPQLGELRGLQRLVASGNALSSVPHELGGLHALKELDLRSACARRITSQGFFSMPGTQPARRAADGTAPLGVGACTVLMPVHAILDVHRSRM
jgi:hypothetical protein